jgi:hypothetical protein
MIFTPFRTFVFVCILSVTFLLTSIIDIGVGYMRVRSLYAIDVARLPESPNRTSIAYLTVVSVDPASRMMLARVRSQTTVTDLDMRLRIDDSFEVMRQDPIIEDSVMVGVKPIAPATIADVKFGTRGIGIISTDDEGRSIISYLLIGDPFPRP